MMEVESLSSVDPDGRTPVFESPYTVALGLGAGDHVPAHTHAGTDILFVVLDGRLTLSVGDQSETLSAGSVARFDGDQEISVTADADVRALVVFADH